ncbi:MAG: bifunctional riboflavin kinase/FAD synthetase [Flammeovirgaceae bacterium]
MKVYRGVEEFSPLNYAVVTSGTFDGIHYGHQKIIERLKEVAAQCNGETVVITYWPHPRFVLNPDNQNLKLLTTLEEKIELLDFFEIEHLLIIPFNDSFSQLSSKNFIENIIVRQINTKKLVIGYDHKFGKNREGSFDYLKNNAHLYGFEIEEIPAQEIDEVAVSSTKIREALLKGQVEIANKFLCHPYSLKGRVVKGNQLGRKISFPTANILVEDSFKLVPANGIYAVRVNVRGNIYDAMLNIGNRPTIDDNLHKTIEVNIFNFQEDIYDEIITISFLHYLREERKFPNLEALKTQLFRDKEMAMRVLRDDKLNF